MTEGEPKKKKSRKGVFTIYVKYDGLFTGGPLRYSQGDMKEINDVSFEGMSYENLVEILKRLFPTKYFYRKVIGLDGCFLKHTCRGELLTAMGRDANNQMYPIAWAVVRVENAVNWGWFVSLLHDDLHLNDGQGISIISDSHKGLLDVVSDWLPHAEHRKCTRHLYANFKKKFSGVQYQRLFWSAASSTLEQEFEFYMEQIKHIDVNIYYVEKQQYIFVDIKT